MRQSVARALGGRACAYWRVASAKVEIPAPNERTLREAAYNALARRAASAAQVRTTLLRKITNWAIRARRAGQDAEAIEAAVQRARPWVDPIVKDLLERGLLDDARFAEARVRGLLQQGKSRRAILAHLSAKGVDDTLARESVPPDRQSELESALRLLRKRRMGPFSREEPSYELRQKVLGVLARAGFDRDTCVRALDMPSEEAERQIGTRGGW